ncbi:MAG TPA: dTMP kinase [Acidobacteriota bacterium]|nr:dTMP kinase [Acidobacteriota bacterium]
MTQGAGIFVTFEGIEGSGKSLQVSRTEAFLRTRGIPTLVTREPGGTEFGRAVRQVLLEAGGPYREPMGELLLYLADRYQHLHEVIEPALGRGILVISDRYHDATRAYQGAARGVPLDTIDALSRLLNIREPDATILLDLEPEAGLARARLRNTLDPLAGAEGRFEEESLSFHRKVRKAYLDLAQRSPGRIKVISAMGTTDEVFARIVPVLEYWLVPTR